MRTRDLLPAAAAFAVLAAAAAGAAELPKSVKDAGAITAAIVTNYPPMDFKDPASGKISGVDPDLGEALAKKLGVQIKWQEVGFEQMIPGLTTGRFDIILSGMSDRADRQPAMDFIDYLQSGPQFYTLQANAATFKSPTDICGKTAGASRRTSFPKEIEEWSNKTCVAAGKPPVTVVGTEGSADARTQLKQGRVDTAVQGSETLPYIMAQEPNTFLPLGAQFGDSPTGIGIAKNNTQLRDALAEAFGALIKDGTYQQILTKWGLQANAVKEVVINGGK
jgi:polar amino acid transport system substrate-binding protein